MSDWLLARLGHWMRPWTVKNPFTNVYGLSRTLLAVATAGTIAFNQSTVLFTPVAGIYDVPRCNSGILKISVFCLASTRLGTARWLSVALLIVVASGWRPRVTAIPHAWVAYSLFSSSTIFDGGDQINLVLTILLLPVALLDRRPWHWRASYDGNSSPLVLLVAWSAIFMIRVQVAAVYFVSGISKLGQAEWANGTAMYYWLLTFGGVPRSVVYFLSKPIFVLVMTWGSIALEVALAAGLVLPRKSWRPLLIIGIVFHLMIALVFDLWSFALAMIAALIIYLRPADETLRVPWIPKMNSVSEKEV